VQIPPSHQSEAQGKWCWCRGGELTVSWVPSSPFCEISVGFLRGWFQQSMEKLASLSKLNKLEQK
jgi:hypothetical protein